MSEKAMSEKQQYWAEYYAANKERLKARSRARYHQTKKTGEEKEKQKAYLRTYYRSNKEKWTAYRKAKRNEINAAKRKKYRECEKTQAYYKNLANKWRTLNPDRKLNNNLQAAYKIGVSEYRALLAKQEGLCAICRSIPETKGKRRRLGVDHCHKTGKVRGLLCSSCNFAIGLFRDDITLIQKSIEYLQGV